MKINEDTGSKPAYVGTAQHNTEYLSKNRLKASSGEVRGHLTPPPGGRSWTSETSEGLEDNVTITFNLFILRAAVAPINKWIVIFFSWRLNN